MTALSCQVPGGWEGADTLVFSIMSLVLFLSFVFEKGRCGVQGVGVSGDIVVEG